MHFNLLECMVRTNHGEMLVLASLESNLYQLDTNMMNEAKMSYLAHSEANSHSLEFGTKSWDIAITIA